MGIIPRFVASLLLALSSSTFVTALYFPQSDLTIRLPYLNGLTDVKLFTLRTLRNDSTTPKHATYEMSTPHEKIVSLDSVTGDITLNALPKGASSAIIVQAKEEGSEAVLEIKIQTFALEKKMNCMDYVQDICFWNTSMYRIYENQPVTFIGTFGPEAYKDICPDFHVTYELENGTEYFHAINNSLFANALLDRDTLGPPGGPGPRVNVQVRCVVWENATGLQRVANNTIVVDILDQDDNPPTVQENKTVEITLGDFTVGVRLGVDDLILKDADAATSNKYEVSILEDAHDAFEVRYNAVPIEHPKFPEKHPPYTAIVANIHAKTTLLPKSPYKVILQATDVSLLPGYGDNSVNITLVFSGPEHRTTTTTLSPMSVRELAYPANVGIARVSSRYSRVAKPSVKPHPGISFSLSGSDAFDVTQKGGIVYVKNETLLKSAPDVVSLKLKWSGADRRVKSGTLQVNLHSPLRISTCNANGNRNETEIHSCANARNQNACESSCGIGSGALKNGTYFGQCVWRSNKASGRSNVSQMSERYPTCSPDLTYCPDNNCDELERLDSRVCPQDCAVEPDVHFGHMNEGGLGIKSGLGTCSCNDVLECTCGVESFRERNGRINGGNSNPADGKDGRDGRKSRDRENEIVTGARKASGSPCGPTCMIGVIGASFFVLVVIGSFVMWRYRMATKGARRECKHRVEDGSNGMAIIPSDYIDRGDGLLIGLDTFTANRHLLLPKMSPPDPKWEFPRLRLTIEQVLGEGEFGRVLRAKAIDIGGWPGPTTVAVKTLKEDACASELADLLSEYQLLKEAQHPNVIRLLGACTTPGGPVYLIIEFAEFGSLRNYLRRSRHLESEGRATCSSLPSASPCIAREELQSLDAATNYTITSRDILSFAWQISKGMAYLADIKLVHRDLAARNVLLATGKVCKISDFGLTRDVYEDDAYLKRSKGRVPVKWMAPESLADHVYTSKSDVWSFGVLLWELVTLGASPYPGVDVHNLYNLLKAGYRMERPANCSQQLYKLMISCWHQEPAMRPSFKELTSHWERMLEDGVEYLDLNPRSVHNQAYFASLHALDSPNSSANDAIESTTGILKTDTVNYLSKPSSEPVTKCDKVDKLHTLWQEPIASFPEEPVKSPYVNDQPSSLNVNHYESPIKLRNSSVTSNSENDLKTPPNERPQSYIDMQGKKSTETDDLLVFGSMDSRDDNDTAN